MLEAYVWAVWKGFALGGGLIIAIGAQNAFVLRQGVMRNHVGLVCTVCFLCDLTLISLGALGLGTLIAQSPLLLELAAWGGGGYLLYFGFKCFRDVLSSASLKAGDGSVGRGMWPTLTATLAVTLLNPHVYIDTVLLVGGLAAPLPDGEKVSFAAGAGAASLLWFYSLGYGAAKLSGVLSRPLFWKALSLVIGIAMWGIAYSLIKEVI